MKTVVSGRCPNLLTLAALLLTAGLANAGTFTVINANDSLAGSLRQAILDANALAGLDTINFNIPGSTLHTINLTSALPTITDPVFLDGFTQPGSRMNSKPDGNDAIILVELNGTGAGGSAGGLTLTAGNSTIRGLVINRFLGDGLTLRTNGGNTIQGNFIGTNSAGTTALGNGFTGLFIDGGANNLIGGTSPGERNVISASGFAGIALGGSTGMNNTIEGNFIGANAAGLAPLGNGNQGIYIGLTSGVSSGIPSNNIVGGGTSGARNIISGNNGGVLLSSGTSGNLIQGNYIGTDVTGTASIGNSSTGIVVTDSSNNIIGLKADGTGAANLVAFNGNKGVVIDGSGTGNAIRGNSIFSNSGGAGIDLADDGVTVNDAGDADTGANNLQNYPVLSSAIYVSGNVTIKGSFNSNANTSFHLEFFGNKLLETSGFGEGELLLGSADVTTDSSGDAAIDVTFPYLTGGPKVTATATDPNGNTSEFSGGLDIVGAPDATLIRRGIFLSQGGTLSTIALSGQTISDVGILSQELDGPIFNNNSTVAFAATSITEGSARAAVFLKKLNGSLTVIAKTGDPAPVPGGAVFADIDAAFDDLALNNNDDLAFIAAYTQGSDPTAKLGIFLKPDAGPMEAVVLFGDVLPGTGGGTLCATGEPNDFGLDGPWMNDSQDVLFKTDKICGGSGTSGESAFARRHGMALEVAVLIGEAAPPPLTGTIGSVEIGRPGITNDDVIAWHSSINTTGDTEAILTRTLGSASAVRVQTGTAAPGTSGTFSGLSAPAINQSGEIFFAADVTGDPVVTEGAFADENGTLSALALQGDSIPGTGATFCDSVEEGSVSDDGRFVFLNENNTNTCPPWAVVVTDPVDKSLSAVALEGQAAPGTIGVFGPAEADVFDEPFVNSNGDVVFIGNVVSPVPPQLLNISTRMRVLIGDNALIGGFIVTGADDKKVIVRGIGPSLPVPGSLQDPILELHDATGAILASNDNWKDTQQAEIEATTIPPTNDAESAIVATLPANSAGYTAILRGKNDTTGVGLVEVYDLDQTVDSKMANISTRGFVDTDDNVMIGGFIAGAGSTGGLSSVLVRAIGPSLTDQGVAGALADPTLELHDASGAIIASNDNWKDTQQAEIEATTIPPTNDNESAIVATLAPGAYTAIVRGANNTTGVGLVEVYNLQ